MADPQAENPSPPPGLNKEDVEEIVRGIGLVLNSATLYGPNHQVARKALDDSFLMLSVAFERCEEITVNVLEGQLHVNDMPVEQKNPLVRAFAKHVADLDVSSFGLQRGMTREKFEEFMAILNEKPETLQQRGGFMGVVAGSGLDHVRATKVTYQKVTEDEVVVSKKRLEDVAGGGAAGESILAFLRGGTGSPDAAAPQILWEASSGAKSLADLILKAADIREDQANIEAGERLEDLVVGSLRRAYEAMAGHPSAHTQKGKKELTKTLLLLETQLVEAMRREGKPEDDPAIQAIHAAVEEMTDELRMDALAAEYMKKRAAIEASEERILKYMKSKGRDKVEQSELKERLEEFGLTSDGWRSLLTKSGAGESAGLGPGPGGAAAVAEGLAALISSMEENLSEARGQEALSPEVRETLAEVEKQVEAIADRTERKIQELTEMARAEEEAAAAPESPAAKTAALSRKRLFKILAEIGQELCQPLAVMTATIDMVRHADLGPVTDAQVEMLNLAAGSGERLPQLAERLMAISGLPEDMTPDAEIQTALYQT